jgi:hypothetical protein
MKAMLCSLLIFSLFVRTVGEEFNSPFRHAFSPLSLLLHDVGALAMLLQEFRGWLEPGLAHFNLDPKRLT